MVPNNVVLAAAVVPLKEPEPVDVRVRLSAGVTARARCRQILDDEIDDRRPARAAPCCSRRSTATRSWSGCRRRPSEPTDGARLADEVIAALASVTGEHRPVPVDSGLRD